MLKKDPLPSSFVAIRSSLQKKKERESINFKQVVAKKKKRKKKNKKKYENIQIKNNEIEDAAIVNSFPFMDNRDIYLPPVDSCVG
jgi:cytidylate kinase